MVGISLNLYQTPTYRLEDSLIGSMDIGDDEAKVPKF